MDIPIHDKFLLVKNPFNPNENVKSIISSTMPKSSSIVRARRGKVKDVYDLGEHLLLYFTDRVSAFDNVLNTPIPLKGIYLCKSTIFWFEKTSKIFPNHFLEEINDRCIKVVKAERIDIEWIVRGYMYGYLWKAYSKGLRIFSGIELPNGLELAEELPEPILTPTTKSDVGHDVEISKEQAISRGIVDKDEWGLLEEAGLRLYEYYKRVGESLGLIVADVKLEFGRSGEGLIQIDEPLTHDTARIWPLKYYEVGRSQADYCLDKEFLREYLRVMLNKYGSLPREIPWPIIQQVAYRVKASYDVLSGKCKVEDLDLKPLAKLLNSDLGG